MTSVSQLTPESPPDQRIDEIIRLLHFEYPDACCELVHENPLELLVATILSAQCTDVRVNKVTPDLFARYPTAADFAAADRVELEEAVRSTGFYRNKAKNIQEACTRIVHEFGGEVPDNMDDLLSLAGVARKTANVVSGHGLRHRRRHRGRHPCQAALQSAWPDHEPGSQEDRTGSDRVGSSDRNGSIFRIC